jgi:hypothetical protein
MFLGILAGVILGVITSFFGMFELFEDVLCPKFLLEYSTFLYYAVWASIGGVIGYFGKVH